jgi:class 3 adenylate cyclase
VTNLAARLADEATGGQVLIEQRLFAEVEGDVEVEAVGAFTLKGSSGRSRPSTSSPSAIRMRRCLSSVPDRTGTPRRASDRPEWLP